MDNGRLIVVQFCSRPKSRSEIERVTPSAWVKHQEGGVKCVSQVTIEATAFLPSVRCRFVQYILVPRFGFRFD